MSIQGCFFPFWNRNRRYVRRGVAAICTTLVLGNVPGWCVEDTLTRRLDFIGLQLPTAAPVERTDNAAVPILPNMPFLRLAASGTDSELKNFSGWPLVPTRGDETTDAPQLELTEVEDEWDASEWDASDETQSSPLEVEDNIEDWEFDSWDIEVSDAATGDLPTEEQVPEAADESTDMVEPLIPFSPPSTTEQAESSTTYTGAPPSVASDIAERARHHVRKGIEHAQRGAIYVARGDFLSALQLVSQSLDTQTQTRHFTTAFANGMRALREAADFRVSNAEHRASPDIERVVFAHETPVLQGTDLTRVTTLMALQSYHAYAEQQLADAVGNELVAADALFGLAKLQPHLDLGAAHREPHQLPTAMSYFRAALDVYPDHYLAANELGVLMARYSQFSEARELLRQAASVAPGFPEVWRNLARVHDRLGETDLAERAREECRIAQRSDARPPAIQLGGANRTRITWMSPEAFAAVGTEQATAQQRPAATPTPPQGLPSRLETRNHGAAPGASGRTATRPRPSGGNTKAANWPFG